MHKLYYILFLIKEYLSFKTWADRWQLQFNVAECKLLHKHCNNLETENMIKLIFSSDRFQKIKNDDCQISMVFTINYIQWQCCIFFSKNLIAPVASSQKSGDAGR